MENNTLKHHNQRREEAIIAAEHFLNFIQLYVKAGVDRDTAIVQYFTIHGSFNPAPKQSLNVEPTKQLEQ